MEEQISKDWRDEVSGSSKSTLKIQDKEKATFIFMNEGTAKEHADFGSSIVFEVKHNGDKKNWYVNPRNFGLLGQLKALGKLTGLTVILSRTGSKKSDTRYKIVLEDDKVEAELPKEETSNPVVENNPEDDPEVLKKKIEDLNQLHKDGNLTDEGHKQATEQLQVKLDSLNK